MGFLQYLGPTLQLLVAVFIFHETVPTCPLDRDGRRVGGAGAAERRLAARAVRAKRLARTGHQD